MINSLLASVCIVTYNHAEYIQKTIESVLSQVASFDFEVIVVDDASTDNTIRIAKEAAKKFSVPLRLMVNRVNLGPGQTYILAHSEAAGKYVFHLDGDDYFLPGKLQIQCGFMESYPGCALSFHQCMSLLPSGAMQPRTSIGRPTVLLPIELFMLRHPYRLYHSSKCYRRIPDQPPVLHNDLKCIDFHVHFEHALFGCVGYLDQVLGVYRQGVGISTNDQYVFNAYNDALEYAVSLGHDKEMIMTVMGRSFDDRARVVAKRGDIVQARLFFAQGRRLRFMPAKSLFLAIILAILPRGLSVRLAAALL